jgi:FixJ family two-component response regulator
MINYLEMDFYVHSLRVQLPTRGLPDKTACPIAYISMPGISGLDLQAKLNAEHCQIPTIFITTHGDEEMRLEALGDL